MIYADNIFKTLCWVICFTCFQTIMICFVYSMNPTPVWHAITLSLLIFAIFWILSLIAFISTKQLASLSMSNLEESRKIHNFAKNTFKLIGSATVLCISVSLLIASFFLTAKDFYFYAFSCSLLSMSLTSIGLIASIATSTSPRAIAFSQCSSLIVCINAILLYMYGSLLALLLLPFIFWILSGVLLYYLSKMEKHLS